MNKEQTVKGYKAYKKGLVCMNFQYKVGETYETKNMQIYKNGFHFCKNPLDVLNYYNLMTSEFTKVEAKGAIDAYENEIFVTDKIKIGEKLSIEQFIKEAIKYKDNNYQGKTKLFELAITTNYIKLALVDIFFLAVTSHNAKIALLKGADVAIAGSDAKLLSAGNSTNVAISGSSSRSIYTGKKVRVAISGDDAKVISHGDNSKIAISGYESVVEATGNKACVTSVGEYTILKATNDNAKVMAAGKYSDIEISGNNSIGIAIGEDNKIKGELNTWITLAEYDNKGNVICVKSAKIDGEKLKPNTWYRLKDEEFIEC